MLGVEEGSRSRVLSDKMWGVLCVREIGGKDDMLVGGCSRRSSEDVGLELKGEIVEWVCNGVV